MTRSYTIIAVVVHFASEHTLGSAVSGHPPLYPLALYSNPLTEPSNVAGPSRDGTWGSFSLFSRA